MLPPEKWFGRPLANLVTPFFYGLGLSGNQMTVARTFFVAGALAILAFPEPQFWPVAAVIYFADYSLDAVDGNLARLRGTVSYLGKYLDGITDGLFHNWAPILAGVGSWQYFEDPRLLILGGVITAMSLSSDVVRARMSFVREWMVGLTGPLTDVETNAAVSVRRAQEIGLSVASVGCFVMTAALFFPPAGIVVFLLLASVFQMLLSIGASALIIAEANVILRRPRQSRHAAVVAADE